MDTMRHPRAGLPAQAADLIDVAALLDAYYDTQPDPENPSEAVAFGTSGHRGSSFDASFNEHHIVAITQALCDHRRAAKIDGPVFLGRDTHPLSEPAWRSAIEVLIANGVQVLIDSRDGWTPTPALSHAIVNHNRGRNQGLADGIVVTPSHNPPRDGGFKYNPPHGGPAGSEETNAIAQRANQLLRTGLREVKRVEFSRALASCERYDFLANYVAELDQVVDLAAIKDAGVRIGVDPLGGASVDYWGAITETWNLDLTVINDAVDPAFGFMTLDSDGAIRMDCSSPDAMASLISHRDEFDIAVGNDADADRHGIVTPDGLMNPNHFLAVSIAHLFSGQRPQWSDRAGIGKTLVSSALIDRVAADLHRPLVEVPVGFKWFVEGLHDGTLGFGGEESAGSAFLRRDGSTWTTDKDGIIAGLLAAEILAITGENPSDHYQQLTARFGHSYYRRLDAPASLETRTRLGSLSPEDVTIDTVGGDPITAIESHASGNGAALGGIKVSTNSAWFAVRPSGTENIQKIYAESFVSNDHLTHILTDAQEMVAGLTS